VYINKPEQDAHRAKWVCKEVMVHPKKVGRC